MFDSWSFGVLNTSLWGGVGFNIDKSHYVIVLAKLKHATENKPKLGVFLAVSGTSFRYKSPIWVIFNALG